MTKIVVVRVSMEKVQLLTRTWEVVLLCGYPSKSDKASQRTIDPSDMQMGHIAYWYHTRMKNTRSAACKSGLSGTVRISVV